MSSAVAHYEASQTEPVLHLSGRLVTAALASVEKTIAQIPSGIRTVTADLSRVEQLDTGGAWVIAAFQDRLESAGGHLKLVGCSAEQQALISTVREALPKEDDAENHDAEQLNWIGRLGEKTVRLVKDVLSLLNFVGLVLHRFVRTLFMPWRFRLTALVSQMQDVGLNAVPIVSLMGFLIGIVLAFQGSVQLRQFGAEVFVVDLIAVSVLRELGILLTAVIVAGRSGSAFTASIGSMKVGEEIDAMRTLGLDPVEVLILPRIMALVIMLPILGVIANCFAMIGGALMSWIELGISPQMFLTRFSENTDVWHFAVGVIKAPFFAFAIGVIGCWQAMQVGGSSESVGRRTTVSVVQSIFLVLVIDAAFSVFFSEIGV